MTSRTQLEILSGGRLRNWVIGVGTGLVALAGLVVGQEYGNTSSKDLHPRLVAWLSAAAVIVFGAIATGRLSRIAAHQASRRSMSAAGGVRLTVAVTGYLVAVVASLGVLNYTHLLLGAGVAGIVIGIAAQQSLSNVFAGLVLLLARPFAVGDRIRVRAGALGGIFDAWVRETSLSYVTLQTDDGVMRVPNSVMLAAGVVQLPQTGPVPPLAAVLPPAAPPADQSSAAQAPSGTSQAEPPGVEPGSPPA